VKGFQAKIISQSLSDETFEIKFCKTVFAISSLFGCKSSAFIEYEISKSISISIPFFLIVSLVFFIFGFAKITTKTRKINEIKNKFIKGIFVFFCQIFCKSPVIDNFSQLFLEKKNKIQKIGKNKSK